MDIFRKKQQGMEGYDKHFADRRGVSQLRVDASQRNLICQRGVIAAEKRVAF